MNKQALTMDKGARIYVAGHKGLVGSKIIKILKDRGFTNLITRTRRALDLTCQARVEKFFESEKPEYVFLAAAKVGGIKANIFYPAQFIYENLTIQNNIIHSAYLSGVKKLLFFGSSCSYPRLCLQPMKEEKLLSGYLEPTNKPYAIAKIAGMEMSEAYNKQYQTNFISCVLANVYGPGDNFDLSTSHVIPGLIRKFHEAKENKLDNITVWGSGKCRREFLYVDDAAYGAIFLMENYIEPGIINLGYGKDASIGELVDIIKKIIGYSGNIIFDISKPDGIPRKLLDVSRLSRLGWQAKTALGEGIRNTYEWYLRFKK